MEAWGDHGEIRKLKKVVPEVFDELERMGFSFVGVHQRVRAPPMYFYTGRCAFLYSFPRDPDFDRSPFHEEKEIEYPSLSGGTADIRLPYDDEIVLIYRNRGRQPILAVDVYGNVYVHDFFHEKEKTKGLWQKLRELIKEAKKRYDCLLGSKIVDEVIGALEDIGKISRYATVEVRVVRKIDEEALMRAIEEARTEFRARIRTLKRMYEARMERLKKELEYAREEGALAVLESIGALQGQGWTLKKGRDGLELYYSGEIHPTHVAKEGRIIELPEELREKYYVRGIHLPLMEVLDVKVAWADDAHHPNVSRDDGGICLGDLHGHRGYEVADKVLKTLSTINLSSAFFIPDELDELFQGEEGGRNVWEVRE